MCLIKLFCCPNWPFWCTSFDVQGWERWVETEKPIKEREPYSPQLFRPAADGNFEHTAEYQHILFFYLHILSAFNSRWKLQRVGLKRSLASAQTLLTKRWEGFKRVKDARKPPEHSKDWRIIRDQEEDRRGGHFFKWERDGVKVDRTKTGRGAKSHERGSTRK